MDFLIDPYRFPYLGFYAPLAVNAEDTISPLGNSLTFGSPIYVGGWCRLSGDTQQILWRPGTDAAANVKLDAASYSQKVSYKCRISKGTVPSTSGTATNRFFYIYNSFGYSGFMLGNLGQVICTEYRLTAPSPLLNEYSVNVGSNADSVYEIRYEKASGYITFYIDNVLVYTSLFPDRLSNTGITIRTPDTRFDYLDFKDCQMVIG